MDFKEMLQIKGFEVEQHNIPINNGYISTLHRISYNKLHHMTNNTCKKLKMKKTKENEKNILERKDNSRKNYNQAILLVHFIFDSSDGWFCKEEEISIPLILA